MNSILETERYLCEDLERLEQAIADRYLEEPKNIRERLIRDHEVAKFLDRFMEQQERLTELRKDKDGARQREVQAITQGDPFEEFYRRLNEIKAYHRKYPNEPVENLERAYQRRTDENGVVYNALGKIDIDSMFSGAEMHGRFMDMNECHAEYQNLHGVKRTTYLQYLGQFDKFTEFGSKLARNNQYFLYLNKVADYLESFFRRTRPLEDPDDFMQEVHEQFEKEWEAETIEGWKKTGVAKKRKREEEEENNDPLFCKACDRAFTNDNTYNAHLEGKKHKKAAERLTGEDTDMADAPPMERLDLQNLKYKAMAEREYRIKKLAEKLDEEREATKINVERKATLTDREWELEQQQLLKEIMEGPTAPEEEEEEQDEKIYNPLKLPLAWDGKPIPFWLYKLHGLGVEFPCEICGNFVYMGRRAFDKHFSEWRHIHGLKCLGITNTSLFREITKIEDAEKLWAKLQADKKAERANTENITEMEDDEGNVMSQQVYEDLKKQGLI